MKADAGNCLVLSLTGLLHVFLKSLGAAGTAEGAGSVTETGTWSVYVHGWQTAGPSADYTMYSWAFDNTGGPTLSVTSAPAEAVIGTSGTVEVNWVNAIDGWYLGIIGHIGATGVMGGTIVEVDNR